METIVVGVDGSPGADAALRLAVREARLRQARVRAVTAWHVPPAVYGGVAFTPMVDPLGPFRAAAEEALDGALERLGDEAAGVEIERVVREGHAAAVLVEEARGADLLVVGSRGRGGFAGLLLGSVSSVCASHAPCPVVIVPEPKTGS